MYFVTKNTDNKIVDFSIRFHACNFSSDPPELRINFELMWLVLCCIEAVFSRYQMFIISRSQMFILCKCQVFIFSRGHLSIFCQISPKLSERFLCTLYLCFSPNVQFMSSGNITCKNKETENNLDSKFPRLTHSINIASVQTGKESFPQRKKSLNNSALEKMPVFTTNLLLPRGRESSCF